MYARDAGIPGGEFSPDHCDMSAPSVNGIYGAAREK